MRIGLDIGSTTIKCVILNDKDEIIFNMYERHYSQIIQKTIEVLEVVEGSALQCGDEGCCHNHSE